MKSTALALAALLCLNSAGATSSGTLTFSRNGKVVRTLSQAQLQKEIAPIQAELVEPHMLMKKTFSGVPFRALLSKVYGNKWAQAKTLVATCVDGYRPILKISTLTTGTPLLAFLIKDEEFRILKAGKPVELAPYYLVWSHEMKDSERRQHLGAGNWPYQVQAFDLRE